MNKHFEHFSNSFDQPVGGSNIVSGNKAPDGIEVFFSL
jgi:hypothetical protein